MWPWLLAALVPGAVYLPLTPAEPSAVRSVVKTLPLAILAAASAALSGPWLLTLALALSAAGDLALSRPGQRAFTLGLAAFALAHAAYLALFLDAWPNPLAAAPILLLAASTEFWLAPHTGPLRWPVRAYVILITAMVLAALPHGPLLAAGALLFLASDFLLAIQTFRLNGTGPRPLHYAIWALYLAAQCLILTAALSIPAISH